MPQDTPNEIEDMKSHKDKISRIQTLLDKLDERLACGEITEARYKEISERYKAEAEKLKDHLTEQELMHEVGLKSGEKEPAERHVRDEVPKEPEEQVFAPRNTKFCSNCGAVIDEMAEICPRCGVRVMYQGVPGEKKSPALAAILSAIIPGTGQVYCGKGQRGLGFFLLNLFVFFLFASASSESPNSDGAGFLALLVIIVWIWNILDARKIARNTNQQVF